MTSVGMIFRPQSAPELLRAAAEAAEAAGVDELWLWEDCFEHGGLTTAAAALAWTSGIRIGVGVLPVPLRNPALAAMEIASLERMFPGRLIAGIGHGVLDWMGQVGARAGSPMTLLREYLTALQALLAGGTVTSEGRYVRLQDVRLAWPPPRKPDIHVGAVRPRTVALAGELGDGVVLSSETTPDALRAARAGYDAARGARAGRVTVYLSAVGGADAAQRFAAERDYWKLPADADLGVHGDAAVIADGVRRYADAGADAVILQPTGADDPVAYAELAGAVRALV